MLCYQCEDNVPTRGIREEEIQTMLEKRDLEMIAEEVREEIQETGKTFDKFIEVELRIQWLLENDIGKKLDIMIGNIDFMKQQLN